MDAGILSLPCPETDIPEDREYEQIDLDYPEGRPGYIGEGKMSRERVIDAVERGDVVECCEYYGIPYLWKESDGTYRGCLLQYRQVTESLAFPTLEFAVDWFVERSEQLAG